MATAGINARKKKKIDGDIYVVYINSRINATRVAQTGVHNRLLDDSKYVLKPNRLQTK